MLIDFELESSPEVYEAAMKVWAWLKRRGLTYDAAIFSRYRWDTVRNERYGRGALFTITHEGPLNELVNYPSKAQMKVLRQFDAMLSGLQLFYEMGYAWSLHFYPVS